MIKGQRKIRVFLSVTTSLSWLAAMAPGPALAQDDAAPPGRVGQIAAVSGDVSYNGAGSGGWAAASINEPVAAGDTLYTAEGARATLALNASQISLSSESELQITRLDDTQMAATQAQGEAFFAIRYLEPGQSFAIATPRGTVSINQNGAYDIIAGDANSPTIVTVLQGAASVTAPGATVAVDAGQQAVLAGDEQTTAQLGEAEPDEFARQIFAETAAPPPAYAPPIVSQMTGAEELGRYGVWDDSPQYGAVWYPQVGPDWAPYREGHWANIAPWGWTWIDDEPWGFAPFHYGRWIDEGGRWGWVPAAYGGDGGPYYQPVYAPAIVTFFGLGITAALLASGSVGWVPLGPGEVFHPYYHCPPAYVRQLNRVDVRDFNESRDHSGYGDFANHRGATFIPAAAMSRGEPVGHFDHGAPAGNFAAARPIDPGAGRLPAPARPMALAHPGLAPHPTAFAERHDIPPAIVTHEHPALGMTRPTEAAHPEFSGNNPGFRPPPAPPGEAFRPAEPHVYTPENRPEAAPFHPSEMQHPPEAMRPPQIERPDIQRPDNQRPEMQRPDIQRPDIQRPELQRPELQRPEMQRPEMQRPEMQRPAIPHPEAPRPPPPREAPHEDKHPQP